jgi:predicted ATPase
MIQSFSIENFKSFRKATLPLSPLTLLIGANASGKSNAIEAVQLLSWLASGRSLNDLLYDVREEELSLRGGLKGLEGAGSKILLGCKVIESVDLPVLGLSVTLKIGDTGPQINGISLFFDSNIGYKLDLGDEKRINRLVELAGPEMTAALGIAGSPIGPLAGTIVGVLLGSRLTGPSIPEQSFGETRKILKELGSIFLLDPSPKRMREYSFLQEKQLKRDGSALSSVLRFLTEEAQKKTSILELIGSLPEQDINDISYLLTPRGEVMVQLHETFGGTTIPREAALLSDGTLRVLAVAAALLSIPEGSVLIVEEIDNGVHPSRAKKLLADIQRIARERNLRVLLTTHNPALLDALPLEAVPDTVACYRDPEEGDSRLIRLQELESYPELVAQGPLGYLVTQGIVDRFLKDPSKRDRETKVEQGLAWLSEFRRAQSS